MSNMSKIISSVFYLTVLPSLVFPASETFVTQGPAPSANAFYGPGNSDAGSPCGPIAVSPSDPNTIFIASNNGGIWRTTNLGTTWTPLTDNKNCLSVAALSFDPTDPSSKTLIAGTGITSNGAVGGFVTFLRGAPPLGAYFTQDGGNTWSELAGNASIQQNISDVAARGNTLLAATFSSTAPDQFGPSYGLFRSTNLGTSFSKVNFPGEASTSPVTCLIGDSNPVTYPNRFWAAVTDPVNRQNTALFASTDQGSNWTQIFGAAQSNGLIQNGTQTVLKAAKGPGTSLAVLVADVATGKVTGVFWSGDNGANWTQVYNLATATIDFNPMGQAVVNSALAIDPTNSNIVYVAGTYDNNPGNGFPLAAYSFDATQPINTAVPFINGAGGTFSHSDVRAFAFDIPGRLLVSNDGGMYIKTIPPSNGAWKSINGSLSLMQNYSNAYDANNNVILSAAQDTGISIQNGPNSLNWTTLPITGDGVNAAINDKSSMPTTSYYYSSVQNLGAFNRVTNTSGVIAPSVFLNLTGGNVGGANNFLTLVSLNRNSPQNIAIGGSTNSGTPAYAVSVFTDDFMSTNFVLTPRGTALPASSVVNCMVYGTDEVGFTNALLAGAAPTGGNSLFLTPNALTTNLAAVPAYAGANPSAVMFDNRSHNRFFVMDSNMVLWQTTNTGANFTDITGNLPMNLLGATSYRLSLEFLSNNGVNALFVGGLSSDGTLSPIAVADSDGSGNLSNYRLFGLGMPNTMINQLAYNNRSDTLLVSAYGRGAWLMYDVTSNFPAATVLQFGLANNNSTPDTSILNNGTSMNRPLTKSGTGVLTISGPSTYTGTTTINGGTLALLGSGSISSSPSLTINSATFDISQTTSGSTIGNLSGNLGAFVNLGSKTLTITQSSPTTFLGTLQAGGIGGGTGGTFIKQGSSTLTLGGVNTYTGGTAINNGTLEINTVTALPNGGNVMVNAPGALLNLIPAASDITIGDLSGVAGGLVDLGTSDLIFGTSTASTTFAGNISATTGSLIKQGSGTASLTGTNSVGPLSVNAGNLAINGNTTSTQATVSVGAVLSGTGTLTSPLVTNFGTISPGNSIGILNIVGNHIEASGSTLLIEVDSTLADELIITGTETIQPNAALAVSLLSITPSTNTYTIISTTGGVTGTFTNVPSSLPTIGFGVTYTANDVLLNVLISSFASATPGGNIGSVARYLDTLTPAPGSDLAYVMNVLRFLNQPQLNQALNQLHPAPYKDLILVQQQSVFNVSKGITYRLNELLDTRCRTQKEKKQFAVWSDIYGEWSEQNNRHRLVGYHSKGGGAMLGVDYCFTDRFVLGFTGAYSYSDVDMNKSRAEGQINSYYGALYAMLHGHHAFLDLSMIGGFDQFDASRKIHFEATGVGSVHRRAHTDHNGWDMDGHLGTGFIIGDFDSGFVTPFISLDYLFLHEDGFKERGADSINLKVRDTDDNMLRSEAGINFTKCFKFKHGKWAPQIRFSVVKENRFADKHYRSNFVGQPGSFVVTGLYPDRTLFSPGAGVTGNFYEDKMSLSLNYDGEFGDGYKDQVARAEFSWGF